MPHRLIHKQPSIQGTIRLNMCVFSRIVSHTLIHQFPPAADFNPLFDLIDLSQPIMATFRSIRLSELYTASEICPMIAKYNRENLPLLQPPIIA